MFGPDGTSSCTEVCSSAGLGCTDGDWGVKDQVSLRRAIAAAGGDADALCNQNPSSFMGRNYNGVAPCIDSYEQCFWQSGSSSSCSATRGAS
eukprot:COSAG06_NODE_26566_length_612_cov_0.824561_2_plen_91_part_01